MLMIVALFTSYYLQVRKVTAIHETVASIFAGALYSLSDLRTPISNGHNVLMW